MCLHATCYTALISLLLIPLGWWWSEAKATRFFQAGGLKRR